ncbi:MAG: hypothetical protein WBN34_00300 [Woeseia sp.]
MTPSISGSRLPPSSRSLLPIAALLLLCACSAERTPPEEALRQWVAAAELAAEEKDRSALLDMISPDYVDARGNDRPAIDRLLRIWFLRQNTIALLTKIDSIEVYNDTAARLQLTVGMAATNNNVLGLSADAYRFELDMVLSDDDWALIAARWGEIGGELE